MSSVSPRYQTMTAKQILTLPVEELITDDAMLVLWSTWMHLSLATEVVDAWGFKYITGMPWYKTVKDGSAPIFGPGVWFQHCTELILIAKKGKPRFGPEQFWNPRPARKGIIVSPRGEHSEKPAELQEWIEEKFPAGPKLELFARRNRAGWTCWGDQCPQLQEQL